MSAPTTVSAPTIAAGAGAGRGQRLYRLLGVSRRHIDLQRVSSALCPA